MLDYPVARLLTGIGIMILGFVGMDIIATDALALSFIFTGLVVTVHQLCWDVLDYKFLDNKVGKAIKRVLFVAAGVGALALSFTPFIDVSVDFAALNYFETAHYVFLTPAVSVAILFCYLTFYYNMKRQHVCFVALESVVIGLIVGLAGAALTVYVSAVLGIIFNVLVAAAVVFVIVRLSMKQSFIYGEVYESSYDEEDRSVSFPKFTKGNDSYKDYTPEQKEKTFQIDVEYAMKMTALKFRQSKSILYGVNLDTEVTSSTSGRNVTFTLDVKISGGTFQNQAEVDHAVSARDAYIKSLMDSIRREAAERAIFYAKNIGCDSAVYISFDVNFRTA